MTKNQEVKQPIRWKRGLPPGKYYEGMIRDYEVSFAPLEKWHRKRTPEELAQYDIDMLALAATKARLGQ